MPKDAKDRDVLQRIHAVIDPLFCLASASPHVEVPIKDFRTYESRCCRPHWATASVVQEVFAHSRRVARRVRRRLTDRITCPDRFDINSGVWITTTISNSIRSGSTSNSRRPLLITRDLMNLQLVEDTYRKCVRAV